MDINDLSSKVILEIQKKERESKLDKNEIIGQASGTAQKEAVILFAKELGPASLMSYDLANIKAIVLEYVSATSHIVMMARAAGIIVMGQCPDILDQVSAGENIVIDADQDLICLSPEKSVWALYAKKLERLKKKGNGGYLPTEKRITRDGIEISLSMNAGLLTEIPDAVNSKMKGIGLFRTELAFMGWTRYPSVARQADLYHKIMQKMGKESFVTFRTLDIGGDKRLPYFEAPEEENPALGWRAIRIGLDRPAVLRTQFRALLRAAAREDHNLKILLPMVSEIAEIKEIKKLFAMELKRLKASKITPPSDIKMGVMLEVPSLLWQLEHVAEEVDFISVGTNDLMQYIFAADRNTASMKGRYDILSPAMLRILHEIVQKCAGKNCALSVCGQAASAPLEAMALIALGYRDLSLSIDGLQSVEKMIKTLDISQLTGYLETILKTETAHSLRQHIHAFARDHAVHME